MRLLRRLILLGLVVTLLPLGASLGYARFWVEPDHRPSAAIIVLSGPGALQDRLVGETEARVDRGIALYQDGLAPRLIMTGGSPGETSAAWVMRKHALAAGVPIEAIEIEDTSRSTLQNAEFVARMAPELRDQPVIIVTHRYHMLRSLASFRWGGFRILHAAVPDSRGLPLSRPALMESIKWPVNALRGGVARLALSLGVPEDRVDPFLN